MRHLSELEIGELLAGTLPPESVGPATAHLEGCPECLASAERLTEVPRDLWAALIVSAKSTADHARAGPLRIFGYETHHELGRGGCGIVYRATELSTGRVVALKVHRAGALASPAEREWFLAESRSAARLRHPNIVTVLAVGESSDIPYYVMEYIPAGSLAARLDGTPLTPVEAAELVEALAGAAHHAHTSGIVHRDVKPGNILLDFAAGPTGAPVPKLADFGMAKSPASGADPTPTKAILGTPSYMAPEQAFGRSREVGPPADIHALGAVLYELLTGRPPFKGATPYETLLLARDEEPVPPRRLRRGLPRDLETICLKCLEKDPARRYGSALDLAKDLRAFLGGRTVSASPVGPIVRLARLVRRHPVGAGLVVFSSALLIATLVAVTVSWRRAVAQGIELAEANGKAEARGAQLLGVLSYSAETTSKLLHNPALVPHADIAAIIEQLERLEQVPEMAGFPEEESRYAYAMLQLADGLYNLGENERSASAVARAVGIFRRLSRAHPDKWIYRYHYAEGNMQLAGHASRAGRLDEAIRRQTEAVRTAEALLAERAGNDAVSSVLANFRFGLAMSLAKVGRHAEAEELLALSLAENRRMVGEYPSDPYRYVHYDMALRGYGAALLAVGRPDAAERYWELVREEMEMCERARRWADWPLIAEKLVHLESTVRLHDAGRPAEAAKVMEHAIGVRREIAVRTGGSPLSRRNLASWLIEDAYRLWPDARAAASFREGKALLEAMKPGEERWWESFDLLLLLIFCPDASIRDPTAALARARMVPDSFPYKRNMMSLALAETGDHMGARAELERILASPPPDEDPVTAVLVRLGLARSLERLGEADAARRARAEAKKRLETARPLNWSNRVQLRRAAEW